MMMRLGPGARVRHRERDLVGTVTMVISEVWVRVRWDEDSRFEDEAYLADLDVFESGLTGDWVRV